MRAKTISKLMMLTTIIFALLTPFVLGALTDTITGYWNMEQSGNVINSIGGGANFTNVSTTATAGIIGNGRLFNGNAGLFDSDTYDVISQNLTIAIWYKSNNAGLYTIVVDKLDGTSGYRLQRDGDATGAGAGLRWYLDAGTPTLTLDGQPDSNNINDNVWHHIVTTINQTGSGITGSLYIDGILRNRGTSAYGVINNTASINIGTLAGYNFTGTLDELGIWNRTLTLAEIVELNNSGLGKTYPFTSDTNYTVRISQSPASITSTNLFTQDINITYNITYPNKIFNSTTPYLNLTTTTLRYYQNGTEITSTLFPKNKTFTYNYTNNVTSWIIEGDQLYPSTSNIYNDYLENEPHSVQVMTSANEIIKIELLNISNQKANNFLEIMANTTGTYNVFYCNNSYTTGNPNVNTNCVLLATKNNTGFNHTHNESKHELVTFPINTTNNLTGTVKVTDKGYFLIRHLTGTLNVGYVTNFSRTNANNYSANTGNTYSTISGTIDAHLHQFGTESFTYNPCVSNSTTTYCDTLSYTNSIGIDQLPPIPPIITNPNTTNQEVRQFLNITYSPAIPFGTATISSYNISLLDSNQTFNSSINSSLTANFYYWNTYNNNLNVGIYYIKVEATDSNGMKASIISEPINITRDSNINVSAFINSTTTRVLNFTLNATDLTTGLTTQYNTTNGWVLAETIKGRQYYLFIDANGYAYDNYTKNATITLNNHSFYLFITNSFNITFYDEVTRNILSGINISFELIGNTYANNYSTNTGKLGLTLLSPNIYTMRYKSLPTYPERTYVVQLDDRGHVNLDLYLVNTTTTITINIKDQDDNVVSDAYIKILRYDISTNAYTVREIVKTNVEGNAYFSGILNTEYYKFIVEYPFGVEVETTSPDYLRSTTLTLRINLEENPLTTYFNSINTYSSLTFNTITNNFNFYYNDASNIAERGCVYVYRTIGYTNTLLNTSCVNSSSGTILVNIANISGYTYTAQGTVSFDGQEYVLKTISKTFSVIDNQNTKNNFFFLTLILTAILSLLFIWNVSVALIVTPLPIFLMSLSGLIPISRSVGITLFLIGITLAVVISKKA